MIRAYTGPQVRDAEAPLLETVGGALMQRAAHGLSVAVARELIRTGKPVYGGRLVVLAGSGNNGGDALFAAARLSRRGMGTTAVLTSSRAHPEALRSFEHAGGRVRTLGDTRAGNAITSEEAARLCAAADVVVDGILGTGGYGGLREPAASLVEALASPPLVVACDLPSGMDADTGRIDGIVLAADLTVTFGAAKSGLLIGDGAHHAGRIHTVPIGIEGQLPAPDVRRLESPDLARLWGAPAASAHKYSRGVLGVVAGSAQYPGAALLTAQGAQDTGVGMIRYLGPEPVARLINARLPEVVCSQHSVAESHVQAWLVGPGIGDDDGQLQRARDAIASGLPTVVDASALPLLPDNPGPHVVLTPHAGELAGVLAAHGVDADRTDIESSAAEHARLAAGLTGATVLLKGATTIVSSPSGSLFSQGESTSWLSTAGSGDTLAGILGALAATFAEAPQATSPLETGASPLEAGGTSLETDGSDRFAVLAAMAASIHGRAAALASRGGPIAASDISKLIGQVFISVHHGDE
ncbi:NAD(P)H-hydrate epimerase [Arthrobacter castelli]|uniref:NAD(P)H-hydrate epimerase n=1 Tax=Arthrobacter castelli TaxID=271431 RepID=UPI00041F56AD|nr:NAD(P)H-hydrate epimerase [Arthrobacter castelli]